MKFKKLVDLSIPITESTPIFPGDPKPCLKQVTAIEQDGFNVSTLQLGSHTGTHVDAPFHFLEDGLKMEEVPLRQFIGKGVVFDVRGKEKGSAITLEDVRDRLDECEEGDLALFCTGWSQYLGQELYFEHPYIDISVIEELLKRGVKTVFIDALNIDPADGSSFAGHHAILSVNGAIGENFMNFEQIDFKDPLIIAFPLKLIGSDGSPVRAVAVQLNE